ncbi:hypothetical protein T439DRAFT_326303 [Meredithblackwellia eburnea MCA 4105]
MSRILIDDFAWADEWFSTFAPTSVGGQAQQPLVTTHGVEQLLLNEPGTIPAGRYPIFVRKEYADIWSATLNLMEQRLHYSSMRNHPAGLVVRGQPGIGKSMYLWYALAMAISSSVPVIFSTTFHISIAFPTDGPPYTFSNNDGSAVLPHKALVLCDSTSSLTSPPSLLHDRKHLFIVQATSPKEVRWKAWSKERLASFWPMNVWTLEEIRALSMLRAAYDTPKLPDVEMQQFGGLDESTTPTKRYYTPEELFLLLGPSARHCFMGWENTGDPSIDLACYWDCKNFLKDPSTLCRAVQMGGVANEDQQSGFHKLFFAIPTELPKPRIASGLLATYTIPTPFIASVAVRNFELTSIEQQRTAASMFAASPQVAGVLYEVTTIQSLTVIKAPLAVSSASVAGAFSIPTKLNLSPFQFDFATRPPLNTLLIPPTNFASIDGCYCSLLADQRIHIVLLQVAINRSHDIFNESIKKVLVHFLPIESIRVSFVFLVPSDEIGKAVTSRWAQGGHHVWLRNTKVSMDVGWAVIELPNSFDKTLAGFRKREKLPWLLPEQDSQDFVDSMIAKDE